MNELLAVMSRIAIEVLSSPATYGAVVGVLVGLYVVWRLAKASYLSVNKLFNLWCLIGVAGLVGVVVATWLMPRLFQSFGVELGWEVGGVLVGDVTIGQILLGVMVAGLVGWWYVKLIRYPMWLLADMVSLGWQAAMLPLSLAWLVAEMSWLHLLQVVVMAGWLGLMSLAYGRWNTGQREGLVFGLWLLGLVCWSGVQAGWRVLAWQQQLGSVEWSLLAATSVLAGGLLGWRAWQQSRRAEVATGLQEMPRGVSEAFREGFNRMKLSDAAHKEAPHQPAKEKKAAAVVESTKSDGAVAVMVSDSREVIAPPVETKGKKLLKPRSRRRESPKSKAD